mgnify:CR=1 FL=1
MQVIGGNQLIFVRGAHRHGPPETSAAQAHAQRCTAAGRGGEATCEPLLTFPAVSIREDHEVVQVLTELPGMGPDDLDISVDGVTLTLQRCGRPRPLPRTNLYRVERFLCRIELPTPVDGPRGEAWLADGVLSLTLPKLAPERARTVKQPF